MTEPLAADLRTPTPAVPGDTRASDVVAIFHKTGAPAVAVLDGVRLAGIITREACLERFSGQFALALWGKDAVRRIATEVPAIDVTMPLSEVARVALARHAARRHEPLAVLDKGVYAGIIDYRALVEALLDSRDRAMRAQLEAERGMRKLQRLESLGLLAGGVSHDFNNILASILGFIGLMKLSPLDDDQRESLGHVEQAARRAADITGRLLAFARGGLARFEAVNMAETVLETMALVEPALPSGIRRSVTLPSEPLFVEGDRGQLQQAMLNVVLNARDAMEGAGRLDVTLRAAAGKAEFVVADTGPGIDPAVQERIFEPFFTTKPLGSGTGLGLAVSYGIVRGHHGEITFESRPGVGTTFALSFPTVEPEPMALRTLALGVPNRTVMIVDDEPLIRKPTAQLLRREGYTVVELASGAEAVATLGADPAGVGAVLLDLVMPGMNGYETFEAMIAIRADLPVIVWTGFAADEHIPPSMKRSIRALLQKPVSPDVLIGHIARHVGITPETTEAA